MGELKPCHSVLDVMLSGRPAVLLKTVRSKIVWHENSESLQADVYWLLGWPIVRRKKIEKKKENENNALMRRIRRDSGR